MADYTALQIFFFLLATFQRAGHASLIEFSKAGTKSFPYSAAGLTFAAQIWCSVIALGLVAFSQGKAGVKQCFDMSGIMKFSYMGVIYCAGDIFEMAANKGGDSVTYTVLSQSKLLITAMLMMVLMGKKQTPVQWNLLILVTIGLAQYVFAKMTAEGKSASGDALEFSAVQMAIVKVLISCVAAVLCERAMKNDNADFLVQLFWIKSFQSVVAGGYAYYSDWDVLMGPGGFFTGWTARTWVLLLGGFVGKAILAIYLLKLLNSMLKNLSEIFGMVIVYMTKLFFLGGVFEINQFLAACAVMAASWAYMSLKSSAVPAAPKKHIEVAPPVGAGDLEAPFMAVKSA